MNMPGTFTGVLSAGVAHSEIYKTHLLSSFSVEPQGQPVSFGQGFALDASPLMLESIAINPNTPSSVLRKLAFHTEPDIRAAVAENCSTPTDALIQLVRDENPDVRYQLAENHHLPMNLLQELAQDDNPYVACRAQRTVRRIEEATIAKSAISTGRRLLKRNQAIKGLHQQWSAGGKSPVELIRKLCSTLTRYARAV